MNLSNYKWPKSIEKRLEEIGDEVHALQLVSRSEGESFGQFWQDFESLAAEAQLLETFNNFVSVEQAVEIMQERAEKQTELRRCSCGGTCNKCGYLFTEMDRPESQIKAAAAAAFIKSESKYAKDLEMGVR